MKHTEYDSINGQDDVLTCSKPKRVKLCSYPVIQQSVYHRIFDENLDSCEKFTDFINYPKFIVPSLNVLSEVGLRSHSFSLSFTAKNTSQKFPHPHNLNSMYRQRNHLGLNSSVMKKQPNVLSSTPFPGQSKCTGNSHVLTERQLYQRLLDEVSTTPETHKGCSTFPKPLDELTVNIDEEVNNQRLSILQKCNFSPITTKSKQVFQNNEQALAIFSPVDDVDKKARLWLEACNQTPYLSDSWITNLTGRYQVKLKQRKQEYELAQANVKFWEKQRILAEQARIDNLELRLACLLRTPPVLNDPYLVPQPIPLELPYQPPLKEVSITKLPVLNASQLAQIESILRSGCPDDVLVDKFRLCVTRRELMTLMGTNWLSDMVINFYLQLLYQRSLRYAEENRKPSFPRLAVLSTFFYAKLTATNGGGYAGIRRWTRQLKLLDQDVVLIPIHDRGMHWCLTCIDFRSKTISYYDSMGSKNDKCLDRIMNFLKEESKDKKGVEFPDPDSWRFLNPEDTVPQQYNGSDCGVFLCTFGEFISRDAPFTFSQDDMPNIRKRMIYEIITQQLLTTKFKLNTE